MPASLAQIQRGNRAAQPARHRDPNVCTAVGRWRVRAGARRSATGRGGVPPPAVCRKRGRATPYKASKHGAGGEGDGVSGGHEAALPAGRRKGCFWFK